MLVGNSTLRHAVGMIAGLVGKGGVSDIGHGTG